jgi:hypothetical protein
MRYIDTLTGSPAALNSQVRLARQNTAAQLPLYLFICKLDFELHDQNKNLGLLVTVLLMAKGEKISPVVQ